MDDIIKTGNDSTERERLRKSQAHEFEIKELGKLKYFSGTKVAHSKEGIFISQHKYVLDRLKETGKLGCKSASILIEPKPKLGEEEDNVAVDRGRY